MVYSVVSVNLHLTFCDLFCHVYGFLYYGLVGLVRGFTSCGSCCHVHGFISGGLFYALEFTSVFCIVVSRRLHFGYCFWVLPSLKIVETSNLFLEGIGGG